jgi:hypothetical protein
MRMPNNSSLLGILVLANLLPLQACATTYSAEPIEAWVVDAETGQPIEGVVVTANWELERGTVGGNVPFGQIMVMETVTDKVGRFYFPAWGPKSTPLYVPVPMLESSPHLVNRDPQMLLFKSGYKYKRLENAFAGDYNRGELRRSDWNGKTVKMETFRGTIKEYSAHLDFMPLRNLLEDCGWKNIPRMLIALSQQSDIFRRNGVRELYSIERYLPTNVSKCGSPQEFFRSFKP